MILGCTRRITTLDFSGYDTVACGDLRIGVNGIIAAQIFRAPEQHLIVAACGRIDNQQTLQSFVGMCDSDAGYIWKAYLKWGRDCPSKLLGDWQFAAYHTLSGDLFLARDQNGKREFFYQEVPGGLCFSSSMKPLTPVSGQLNHRYVTSLLSKWRYKSSGTETFFKDMFRLNPGHTLTYTSGRIKIEKYWHPERIPLKYYANAQDYSDELLEISKEAVRCRIPGDRQVASMLSGGLDSGTVSVLAAEILGELPLVTLSHTPLYDKFHYESPKSFLDETDHIRATAGSRANIRPILLNSENISPIDGIEQFVQNFNICIPNAVNAFWIADIYRQAAAMGFKVLFSAVFGNVALSYGGVRSLLPMKAGRYAWNTKIVKPAARRIYEYRHFCRVLEESYLNQERAQEYKIKRDVLLNRSTHHFIFKSPKEDMLGLTYKSYMFRLMDEDSPFHVSRIDPTGDIRIIEHCLGIPNQYFFNEQGENRQVLRRMMAGRLPDKVLYEKRRGMQAADIFSRFTAEIDRVEDYSHRFEKNPTFRHFINTSKLKADINLVKESRITDVVSLNRILNCIMLGVFLEANRF